LGDPSAECPRIEATAFLWPTEERLIMLWAIWSRDVEGSAEIRSRMRNEHQAYMKSPPVKVVVAGPLQNDARTEPAGSLFVVEAADRATVEAFVANDPLNAAGVWRSTEIVPIRVSRVDLAALAALTAR
jgi:uncharacterized protein